MLSSYYSEHFYTDAFVLRKMFFGKLILDVKTTLRLLKPHCKNFWTLKMKVVSAI